jgi:hypothetical protein
MGRRSPEAFRHFPEGFRRFLWDFRRFTNQRFQLLPQLGQLLQWGRF